jgi:hypothetical protein
MNWALKVRYATQKEKEENNRSNESTVFIITVIGGELDGCEYVGGENVTLNNLVEKMAKDLLLRNKTDKFKFKGIQDLGDDK